MKRITKCGLFDWETLTVKFGGELSKPENIFTAQAIKVPTYTYERLEREDAGGGWYGAKQKVTVTVDRLFIIVKDGKCIGYMNSPYTGNKIKTPLIPLEEKIPREILSVINEYKLTL